jgi:multidrug efflux system membrane fusion protein
VVLTLTVQKNAVVMPSSAAQTGQQGQYVFVIKPDLTVESRPVTVARTFNDLSVVAQGVEPGEQVVTDGQLQLVPGAKVEIKNEQGKTEESKGMNHGDTEAQSKTGTNNKLQTPNHK